VLAEALPGKIAVAQALAGQEQHKDCRQRDIGYQRPCHPPDFEAKGPIGIGRARMKRKKLRENGFVGNKLHKQKRDAGGDADCGELPDFGANASDWPDRDLSGG